MSRRIALTPGEPSGIGPDLAVLLAQQVRNYELVAIADPGLLQRRAELLGLPLNLVAVDLNTPPAPSPAGTLVYQPITLNRVEQPGTPDPGNAAYVLNTLDEAVRGCLEHDYEALVTGPIHKGVINDAGIPFTGHTEYLAEKSGGHHPVMMLATDQLRVALATTHLPLSEVPAAITEKSLETVLNILNQELQEHFGRKEPRILVSGLNPHAGEDGHLGREEIKIITPALDRLRDRGLDIVGPLPADTLFTPRYLDHADAVLAMYHDQGLPVLKYSGFGRAVNITLGLPLIRTSVDHGTACDLAGTGNIDTGSLQVAIETALGMVNNAANC
jgi:4-hydroxythreonine-4-phosphate dehydrogenase